jgi:hypothetical protein
MTVKKYRWSKVYESSEEELVRYLLAKKIEAERWTAEAYDEAECPAQPTDLGIWCAEGSIAYFINGQKISIQPGDGFVIPANMTYKFRAGISGCVCYQYST